MQGEGISKPWLNKMPRGAQDSKKNKNAGCRNICPA